MRKLILVAIVTLAGCQAGRLYEAYGDIRVQSSSYPGADYEVHLRNTFDLSYNPDNEANRHKWALEMVKAECPTAKIVAEKSIKTGEYLGGRPSKVYTVYLRCPR